MSEAPQPVQQVYDTAIAAFCAALDKVIEARAAAAAKPVRWTAEQIIALAASAVAKVDLLGDRGTTLCSMEEIAAMAALIAATGVLPPPHQRVLPERYRNGGNS